MSTQLSVHGYIAKLPLPNQEVDFDAVVYARPTATVAVLPTTGDTSTTFVATSAGTCDADAGTPKLDIIIDGGPPVASPATFKLASGTHTVIAAATDNHGETGHSLPQTIAVTVTAPPPVLAFPGDTQKGHIRWGLSQPIADHSVHVGVHRTYFQGLSSYSAAISTAKGDLAGGTVPWLSIKGDGTWQEMASNTGIDTLLTGLMKLIGPVILTFNHEPMKVTGVPDDPGGASAFLAACRHIRARMTALGARNIAFVPVYMAGCLDMPTFATWWDGTIFDAFGIDIYFQHGPITSNPHWVKATNFARAANKKLVIGEWGVLDDPDGAANIKASHDAMLTSGVALAAYFDSNANSVADWTLAGARLDQWILLAEMASSVAAGVS